MTVKRKAIRDLEESSCETFGAAGLDNFWNKFWNFRAKDLLKRLTQGIL